MPTTTINGLDMYYRRRDPSAGPPLLLIAGLGRHAGAFAPQYAAFAEHFDVIAFDNRGAGRTSAPDEPYTMRQMAADAVALLDSLSVPRAHVLGTSLGGMVAQEMAINHPERIDALVLACTRAKPVDARRLAGEAQRALAMAELPAGAREAYGMPWSYTTSFIQDPERVQGRIRLAIADPYPIGRVGYLRQLDAVLAHDTLGRLDRISARTLVLVGAEDILTPPAESEVLARDIPNATLRVLQRGGHAFSAEYATEFNAAVLEFLRR